MSLLVRWVSNWEAQYAWIQRGGVLSTMESFPSMTGHVFLVVVQRKVAASPFAQRSGKADAAGPVALRLFCSEFLLV